MPTHSVAEAKNSLSELIDRALNGEGVTITRHGKPVIEFRPIPIPVGPVSDSDLQWLAANRPSMPGRLPRRRCEAQLLTFDEKMARSARSLIPAAVARSARFVVGQLSPREFNLRTGIVIGLPMTTASYSETNPFAVRFVGAKGALSYILGHQPKSVDWRARAAKPHP